ncbi:MAG: hypothetical protein ABSF51_13530 [Verrucomicrobiota bacterium]|jgi:hypothetical protein
MKKTNINLAILAASAFAVASVATVHADITGYLWDSSSSGLSDANGSTETISGVPGSSPSVTFTVPSGSLNFNSGSGNGSPGDGYTIGGFLATGGATITGGTEGTADANVNLDDSLIQLVGLVTVVNGQSYNVEHDDGVVLTIGSTTLVNEPGPTSAVTTDYTWTGASGTYSFDLLYAEVAGPPAVLITDLPLQPVPEATTVIAGMMLLLPLGASTFRMLRKSRIA